VPDYDRTVDGKFASQDISDRFWAKVEKTDSCWNFTGRKSEAGYGRFRVDLKLPQAHHVSYYLKTGEWLPLDLEPDHTCKNPSCVRWAHGHLEGISHEEHVKRTSLTHRNRNKIECKWGHSDWSFRPNGKRLCNQCNRDRYHARTLGMNLESYYA
jgi:hypothetical protein